MTADEIRQTLASSREQLLETIKGVTEEQFKRRPADGSWCIAEVLAHQLVAEKIWAERVRLALEHDGAAIEPIDQEAADAQARAGRTSPVPQLIHGLLAARREIEKLVDEAESIEGGFERAAVHPATGRQTVAMMLGEQISPHEMEHVEQIESLKGTVTTNP